MGRRKLYTDAEKKLLKHYRTQIYYYGKQLASFAFKYDYDITFKNIRSQISQDEAYPLLDIFSDTDKYFITDFRQVAIDEGGSIRDYIDKISRRLGYGSIDQYEARTARENQLKSRLDTAVKMYESIRKS